MWENHSELPIPIPHPEEVLGIWVPRSKKWTRDHPWLWPSRTCKALHQSSSSSNPGVPIPPDQIPDRGWGSPGQLQVRRAGDPPPPYQEPPSHFLQCRIPTSSTPGRGTGLRAPLPGWEGNRLGKGKPIIVLLKGFL